MGHSPNGGCASYMVGALRLPTLQNDKTLPHFVYTVRFAYPPYKTPPHFVYTVRFAYPPYKTTKPRRILCTRWASLTHPEFIK